MNEKKNKIKMDRRLTIYCFVPALLFLVAAIGFAMETSYNKMALATAGAIFGPGMWVYQRDLMRVRENYSPEIAKITRALSAGIMLITFGLAWMSDFQVASSLLLVAAFGQYWFVENPTAGQRLYHGVASAAVGVWGYIYYRPVAYVFVPISFYLAYDFFKRQRAENAEKNIKKSSNKNKTKKKKKKKK